MSHGPDTQTGAETAPAGPLGRAVVALVRLGAMLSVTLILVTFAIVIVAITRRYVLGQPILWGDQLIGYLLVAIVMLGAAEALRRGDHIGIDLLADRAGPRLKVAQSLFSSAAVLAFAVVLGLSTWESIVFARLFGSYSVGYIEIETWIPQVPVVAGMILLFMTAALGLYRTLRGRPQ